MAQINLQIFGKIRNSSYADLAEYYQKLIGRYFSVNIRVSKANESKKIDVADLTIAHPYIVLSEKGKEFSTLEFVPIFEKYLQSYGNINFIIGNSEGVTENLMNSADLVLSLSRLTMPHELAIVVLLEQLFRVANLKNGGKYHK